MVSKTVKSSENGETNSGSDFYNLGIYVQIGEIK